MRTVTQGEQKRYFLYDSLSRLIRARNPEQGTNSSINLSSDSLTENNNQWSVAYSYDSNGNLLSKTDAKNITTSYVYDSLNRVTTRNYSDNTTPNVSYFYDGKGLSSTPSNSKGKLTKVSGSVSETRYTSFDSVGRITSNEQATDGVVYPMSYSYNIGGALVSETYPSGRVVTNSFDSNGKLSNISSAKLNQTPRTYANGFTYTSHGAVSSMRLGNGRFESTQFNSRLQPTQIALGSSASDTSLLKLNYDFGTTDNNGNVKTQTITAQDISHPHIQTYTYDSLNRLKSATETANNQEAWKQTYRYDRYGNRNFDTANTSNPTSQQQSEAVFNPTIDTAKNRFSSNQGYLYDANGNVIQDATGKKFVYDGENKQTSFGKNGSETNGGLYSYDGGGQRIKKTVISNNSNPNEITVFVYDATGKMVAEYTNQTQQETPETRYLTADMLGTPRIITDSKGAMKERHDYMPFGEEITINNEDKVRQKFTGQQRDGESGLDYFEARYYNTSLGRFYSCDPVTLTTRHIVNPQHWNFYIYVVDNPINLYDPDGRRPKGKGAGRVIDVYIGIKASERDTVDGKLEKGPNWRGLIAIAKKKRVILRVYYNAENAGESQTDAGKILTSMQAKNRYVLYAGHANLGRLDGDRIVGNGIAPQGNQGYRITKDGIVDGASKEVLTPLSDFGEFKAKAIFLNGCDTTDFRPALAAQMREGSYIIYNDAGNEGEAGAGTNERITFAQVRVLVLGGTIRQAQIAGQKEIDKDQDIVNVTNAGDRKVNQGDRIQVHEVTRPH